MKLEIGFSFNEILCYYGFSMKGVQTIAGRMQRKADHICVKTTYMRRTAREIPPK